MISRREFLKLFPAALAVAAVAPLALLDDRPRSHRKVVKFDTDAWVQSFRVHGTRTKGKPEHGTATLLRGRTPLYKIQLSVLGGDSWLVLPPYLYFFVPAWHSLIVECSHPELRWLLMWENVNNPMNARTPALRMVGG